MLSCFLKKKPKENDILENRKNSTKIIFQYCEVRSSTLSCFLLQKKVRSYKEDAVFLSKTVTKGYVYASSELISTTE